MQIYNWIANLLLGQVLLGTRLPLSAWAFLVTTTIKNKKCLPRASNLFQIRNEENTRRVIDEKNSILSVDAELRYGVTIGQGKDEEKMTEGGITTTSKSSSSQNTLSSSQSSSSSSSSIQNEYKYNMKTMIERMTKPRAYPLFLLEKLAILIEDAVSSLTSSIENSNKDDFYVTSQYQIEKRPKEKIVVLGTGWGAAAFLKDIDTNTFDVTVISPRNFFLFTPMLAGASVGTVEFRSITENIRQV